ncbi:MSHA biogenesis protein MshM [Desulfurella amilsii]|uniref:MSHA biogenesis protein MshM n=1 Tax=Desulfurella amilsii TaxID=1562698 RepID=A0A1X4XX52_9BACT|nr:AAA family ATPase [Desulfurella amilsii]OSS42117.1 MSHA biogenesis protein MshM [Desulfurella amilsii]
MNQEVLDFFKLSDNPFRLTPDLDFYFPSKSHTQVLEVLKYFFNSSEAFAAVVGEVGCGKTMLVRMLLENFLQNFETAVLISPILQPKELVLAILADLGVHIDSDLNLEVLLRQFQDYLLELSQKKKKLAIIIDEAQDLPNETLEQLRLLSNIETTKTKLMQILLVGQPEFDKKLSSYALRQLRQRISVYESLDQLSTAEALHYVLFRLSKVQKGDLSFTNVALKTIIRSSSGIPRLINTICSRTLFIAYSLNTNQINFAIVKEALQSLNIKLRFGF